MPHISRPASRPPAAAPLRLGASGPQVSQLQQHLNARGEKVPVNGTFGPRTQEAVRRLQLTERIPANGVVGASTAAALSRNADSFQAAPPKRAPVSLAPAVPAQPEQGRGPLSLLKQAGQNVVQSFDLLAMRGGNALSAHGAKSDANSVSSQNQVLLDQPGHFSSSTRGEYRASADALRDLIMAKDTRPDTSGNVGWAKTWKGSAVEGLKVGPNGTECSIYPLGKTLPVIGAGPKVNIKLGTPTETRGADGRREMHIPMTFTGDFTSAKPGEITIRELPSGKRELRFNWPDTVPTGNIPDPGIAAIAHTSTLEKAFFKNLEAALTSR